MATRSTDSLPARLKKARDRFETWRKTRKRGERIPDRLWDLAVRTAAKHGPYNTAQALRLDYMGLKRRMAGSATKAKAAVKPGVKSAAKIDMPSFVELTRAVAPSAAECVAWVEDPSGAKMRIELRGLGGAEIGALARSFAGGGR